MTTTAETTATQTDNDHIVFEEHGPITVLKLNRPERLNAFIGDMQERIGRYFDGLNHGTYETRCVIVTGEGRGFSAGADVGGSLARRMKDSGYEQPPWHPPHPESQAVRAMRDCDVPIIAAINGPCAGMGWGFAMASDIRIASTEARFQVAQLRRGIMADFGLSYFLPEQIGTQAALDLMLTGRMIDAQRALELGVVYRVVPHEQLMASAFELANEIAAGPPLGIAASKHAAYMARRDDLQRVNDYTNLAVGHLFLSEDFREGVNAFLEKREMQFKGR